MAAAGLFGIKNPAQAQWQAQAASAAPAELAQVQPALALRGRSTLTFFGMEIYEARLWAPQTFALDRFEAYPFALELQYRRALSGNLIAQRSVREMQRQSDFDAQRASDWEARMQALFPDVQAGDRITGIYQPGVGARFAVNGKPVGEVRDALFAKLFFGIWLSPQTSEPAMRCALATCS